MVEVKSDGFGEAEMLEGEPTDCERRLLGLLRKLKFGEVLIKLQDGEPAYVERTTEKFRLKS